MACSSINYGDLPGACRPTDMSCNENMAAGSFLMALDYVTTGEMDDQVTSEQIKGLTKGGQLTDNDLQAIADRFNRNSHRHGLSLSAIPFARNFQAYLRDKHACVYNEVFGASIKKEGEVNVKTFVKTNLLSLAAKLEASAKGNSQTIDQRDFVVTTYDNGFTLKDSFDPLLVEQMGGQENAARAYSLLSAAFSKLMAQTRRDSNSKPCDKVLSDGNVDVSACYTSTAVNLRKLARLL